VQDLASARPKHGGNLAWAASLSGCSPSDILDFSASINPLGPPQTAIAAIQEHLSHLRDYPDPNYSSLRQALSQFHSLSPDWILPGNGSAELLTWAARELAALHQVYLLTPAFGDYTRALKAFLADIVEVQSGTWGNGERKEQPLSLNLSSLSASRGSGLLLNNPHNPTGQLLKRSSILPLLDQFELVVVDEAFMDFLPPDEQESVLDWVQNYPNLVVLRSLTKFYSLAGLRLGYTIAHPDRLKRWQQWRDPWSVNVLAAAAGIAAIQDKAFQQQTWDWLKPARSHLFQGISILPGLSPLPGAANYLLVQSDHSVLQLQHDLLKQHRILIRDCLSFAELGDRYFRVAIRTQAENQQLLNGLASVLQG
jgi:L-threonine-O-3-phosphate decarboxylase